MRAVIDACFSRPGAIILTLLLIFGVGISAYQNIPKEANPDVEIPIAYVSVSYQGISPEDAEKLLLKPLELPHSEFFHPLQLYRQTLLRFFAAMN